MDIGTAKPSPTELASIPHHLFDIIHPDEDFSLAQYQKQAYDVIDNILKRNKIPFLVGGSGQYIWGLLEGWNVPRIPPDEDLRARLELIAKEKGIEELYQKLIELDSEAAQNIDKRNIRRVIRALEVNINANKSFSSLKKRTDPGYLTLIIGLTSERKELYQKTDARVDEMIKHGLVNEVEKLLSMGYSLKLPSMSSIGYKQIGMMLSGQLSREESVRQMKTATHRFIRHQYAWFKLGDKRINWFNVNDNEMHIMMLISDHLQRN
jgi:tRNA dimethylallyltransferase